MRKYIFMLVVLAYPIELLFSISAYHKPIIAHQPDGSLVTLTLVGDEHRKCAQNAEGYTLICNSDNQWVYAVEDSSGGLLPSNYLANDQLKDDTAVVSFLKGTPKGIKYNMLKNKSMIKGLAGVDAQNIKRITASGERKGLVILMNFSDVSFSTSSSAFDKLFNTKSYVGLSSGSVRDFFLKNSYNQLDYLFDVVGPYTASRTMAYYGANDFSGYDNCPEELIKEAVIAASASVDYSDYDSDNDGYVDNVHVVFAGYGEESGASTNAIWSHEWALPDTLEYDGKTISVYSCAPELRETSGSTISAIGVHCHELTHTLGVPDFYDTDGTDNGYFQGTGDWDLMANGSWNNDGDSPAEINPYSKIYILDWADAETLSDSTEVNVKFQCRENAFYRINTQTTDEFFLLENRQQAGFDAGLPYHGLLIYHIHSDMNFENNDLNAAHPQKCYPVVASSTVSVPNATPASYGVINSSGCPYPGSGAKNAFTDETTPCSKSWSLVTSNCFITDIQEADSLISFKFARISGEENAQAGDTTILYYELFDDGFPLSWSQDLISGTQQWVKSGGSTKTTESPIYISLSGNKMSVGESTTMAISGELDPLGSDPVYVSFSYKCLNNAGLSVYYDAGSNNWERIDSLDESDSESWLSVVLALPNIATNYSLGFLGSCQANSTICLDSIKVFSVKDVQTNIESVEANQKALQWSISNSQIYVETTQNGNLYVYDLHGNLVRTITLNRSVTEISLPSGLYLYRFNKQHGLICAP